MHKGCDNTRVVIERVSSTERLLEEEWSGEVSVISIRS